MSCESIRAGGWVENSISRVHTRDDRSGPTCQDNDVQGRTGGCYGEARRCLAPQFTIDTLRTLFLPRIPSIKSRFLSCTQILFVSLSQSPIRRLGAIIAHHGPLARNPANSDVRLVARPYAAIDSYGNKSWSCRRRLLQRHAIRALGAQARRCGARCRAPTGCHSERRLEVRDQRCRV
jgi:hypothetical protein